MDVKRSMALLVFVFGLLLFSCSPKRTSTPPLTSEIEGALESSAMVKEDEDLNLVLGDGASVVVAAGGIEPGTEVKLTSVEDSELLYPALDNFHVGQVYEISAPDWNKDLYASVTLPIVTDGLSDEEASLYQLAYYEDGEWIAVPSNVDLSNNTVTGTVRHFSIFGSIKRALYNKAPNVTVVANPSVYANVPLEDTINLNLEDLIIEVYAYDPEFYPVEVYVTIGLVTEEVMFAEEAHRLRIATANLIDIEAAMLDLISGQELVVPIAKSITDQLGNPITKAAYLDWVHADIDDNFQGQPGEYYFRYRVRFSGLELRSSLREIHIFVQVEDDMKSQPVRIEPIVIPVTQRILAEPAILESPGPTGLYICPARPTFHWKWAELSDKAESYGFFLSEGSNPWDTRPKWTCRFSEAEGTDCDPGGTKQVWDKEWTPSEPLNDDLHSWGIASSTIGKEKRFRQSDPFSTHSSVFQFTVDRSLKGNECIPPSEQNVSIHEQETPDIPVSVGGDGITDLTIALSQAVKAMQSKEISDWMPLMNQSLPDSEKREAATALINLISPYEFSCLGYGRAQAVSGQPWYSGWAEAALLNFRARRSSPLEDKDFLLYVARPTGENESPYFRAIPYYKDWNQANWPDFDQARWERVKHNFNECPTASQEEPLEIIVQPEPQETLLPTPNQNATPICPTACFQVGDKRSIHMSSGPYSNPGSEDETVWGKDPNNNQLYHDIACYSHAGCEIILIDGPVCVDGKLWWLVEAHERIKGSSISGWQPEENIAGKCP